ncbi:MAG: aminotransferase class III-fold pyridoxal phosphate-dependent enzyme [Deltaproteobacteria bacterium]|nr:aminotransferase class III-fold pyridoxal phosphate-dependent enzyme [Deltaproteobacteria bacterium]MBW2612677.1 aminotransferase class III-fold pyridoxal phosphate-dependent enzyme [Deltaproteobacteria bacterium]MBW2676475.1 aminotransferase class III-fold pyridoxal phosphate-dependent enzyme [Deltaproteobacteria bacterium]
MIDLKKIPSEKTDLDNYEVENIFHSWSYQPAQAPLRVESAKGIRFTTADGRERLDFSSCFVSHNIGHQDPRVIKAICQQAQTLASFAPSLSTRPRSLLGKMLEEITPGDLSRTFISLGGTEANEAAVKICHQFTGRRKMLARYRSYHGGTATAMSLSSGDARGWAQVLGGTDLITVPQPYCYRCMFGQTYPACDLRCVKYVDEVVELEGGSEKVAGIICEPVTGANGIIVPPPEYFPELRKVCDKWEILMIADEVMSGFGRTGKWFAMDHWDVVPDIMTMAKGISCGYLPLGATVVRKYIGDRFKDQFFAHGATYAGHALGCAAALAVIPIYQEDLLIENSEKMGKYLLGKALELQEKHPCVGDVRGLGLFVGLELVKNKKTREPIMPVAAKIRQGTNPKLQVAQKLGELGMMAMAANPGNVIAMAPPLIITRDEIDEGIAIMDEALKEADKHTES